MKIFRTFLIKVFFHPQGWFLLPNDNVSTEGKTTREEEEKEQAELDEAEEAIWSSWSVGEGLYKESAVGDIHIFPIETLVCYKLIKLRIPG